MPHEYDIEQIRRHLRLIRESGLKTDGEAYSANKLAEQINRYSSTYLDGEQYDAVCLNESRMGRFIDGDHIKGSEGQRRYTNLDLETREAIVRFMTDKKSDHYCIEHDCLIQSSKVIGTFMMLDDILNNVMQPGIPLTLLDEQTYLSDCERFEFSFTKTKNEKVMDAVLKVVSDDYAPDLNDPIQRFKYRGFMINTPEDNFIFYLQDTEERGNLYFWSINVDIDTSKKQPPPHFSVLFHGWPLEVDMSSNYRDILIEEVSNNTLMFKLK